MNVKSFAFSFTLCLIELGLSQSTSAQVVDPINVMNSGSAQAPIVTSNWLTVYPPTLGNVALSVAQGVKSGAEDPYYFLPPYFHFNKIAFSQDIENKCAVNITTPVTAELPVKFGSKQVNDEIVKAIRPDFPSTNLRPYPVGVLRIVTGGARVTDTLESTTRDILPPGVFDTINNGYLASATAFDFAEHIVPITDTCAALREIARTADVQAYIYTQVPNTKVTYFSAVFSNFLKSKGALDLIQDQKNTGYFEVTTRSKGTSAGLNLGGTFGGSSKSSDKTVTADKRGRWVSSNLITDAVSDWTSSIQITNISQDGDPVNKDLEDKLLDFLLKEAPNAIANFQKTADGQLNIIGDHFDSVTLNQAEVDQLLKSSNKPELIGTQDTSGSYGAVSGSDKKSATIKDDRGIEWKNDGIQWTPVSANLHFLSTSELRGRLISSFDDVKLLGTNSLQRLELVKTSTGYDNPRKLVTVLPAGLFVTVQYWSHGNNKLAKQCLANPDPVDGQTKIGGEVAETIDGRKTWKNWGRSLGCKSDGFCDSHGEFCVSQVRKAGCIINNEWLNWYKDRQRLNGLLVRDDEICASEEKSTSD